MEFGTAGGSQPFWWLGELLLWLLIPLGVFAALCALVALILARVAARRNRAEKTPDSPAPADAANDGPNPTPNNPSPRVSPRPSASRIILYGTAGGTLCAILLLGGCRMLADAPGNAQAWAAQKWLIVLGALVGFLTGTFVAMIRRIFG